MVNLITENIDIWTTAQISKTNGQGNGINNHSPYGISKLRELILELAVRGKLVSQDPNDEPASVLLKKIAEEKKRLIKEGKIREQKPLPAIGEEEKPFELPVGWEWARLGDVTTYGILDKAELGDVAEDTWVLELEDVEKETSKLLQKVRCADRQFLSSKNRFYKGDVIYGKLRPYLDKVIVADENGVCTTEMIPIRGYNNITPQYLRLVMKSPYFIQYANESTHGMNLPRMGTDKARLALFPMISEREEHRIVAKVDELMTLCNQFEQQQTEISETHQTLVGTSLTRLTSAADQAEFIEAWQRISSHFNTLFITEDSIDQLKQAILQLAVIGKLVPQDPNDEPASVLLEKVAEEKERLVKEGKIKKEKPLPKISEDERPFELPDGWEWVRFGAVFNVTSSKRIHVQDYVSEGVPFFRSKEIGELNNNQPVSTEIYIAYEKFEELRHLPGFPNVGDLMLTSVGSIGNTWICDSRSFYYKDGNITKIGAHQYADMRYAQYFIDSPLFDSQVTNTVSGTAYNALTIVKLNNLVFPLPPLTEQHCIVAKVDELMKLCDALNARMKESQITQVHLADAMVERTIAQ